MKREGGGDPDVFFSQQDILICIEPDIDPFFIGIVRTVFPVKLFLLFFCVCFSVWLLHDCGRRFRGLFPGGQKVDVERDGRQQEDGGGETKKQSHFHVDSYPV